MDASVDQAAAVTLATVEVLLDRASTIWEWKNKIVFCNVML